MWYWFFKFVFFTPVMKVMFWPKVVGKHNIPDTGAAVMAANHSSAWDTIVWPASIKRRMTFPAKAELFVHTRNPFRNAVAWFLTAIGQVPVDRRGGRASTDALSAIHEALGTGEIVGIFPEGTRSVDGRLYKAKSGVARLLLSADVPLIPVGLMGMRRHFPFRPTIIIGKPIHYADLAAQGADHEVLRWVADDVMAQIAALTGQTYVDIYASSAKHGEMSQAEIDAQITADPHHGAPRPASTDLA